jgi:hypothetical protein
MEVWMVFFVLRLAAGGSWSHPAKNSESKLTQAQDVFPRRRNGKRLAGNQLGPAGGGGPGNTLPPLGEPWMLSRFSLMQHDPTREAVRIGTLARGGERTAAYIREILPHGFESFQINFWRTLAGVNLEKLARQVGEVLAGSGAVISSLGIYGNPNRRRVHRPAPGQAAAGEHPAIQESLRRTGPARSGQRGADRL